MFTTNPLIRTLTKVYVIYKLQNKGGYPMLFKDTLLSSLNDESITD